MVIYVEMKRIAVIAICVLPMLTAFSQQRNVPQNHRKGTIYLFWGWNTTAYGRSNLHFRGEDYDFTLYQVRGQDLPRRPFREPQNNYGLGYFFRDNWAMRFSVDHMKYVLEQYQIVRMKGSIMRGGPHSGNYDGDKTITPDFLRFEHTDGLNYINLELEKYYSWYHSRNQNLMVSGMLGGGGGVLYPRTDVHLLDYPNSNLYHVAGFGVALKAAAQLTVFRHVYGKIENKFGYIHMPSIQVHELESAGKASQSFLFSEMEWIIGVNFSLRSKKNN